MSGGGVKGGLELVRRFALVRERMARRALAEAVATLGEAEGRAADLAATAELGRARLAAEAARGVDAQGIAMAYRHVASVEQAQGREEAACVDLRRRAAAREAHWQEGRRTLRGLEAILARRAERARRERERREQRETDDLVNSWGGFDAVD
jgi:flagellar export protein FliJ